MKQIAAILLSLCLLLQCLAHVAVRGMYELNKEYVAAALCENRDKPELNCCGKCVLDKELRKADDNSAPSERGPVKTLKLEVLPCVLPPVSEPARASFVTLTEPIHTPVLRQLHDRLAARSVFHPPAFRC